MAGLEQEEIVRAFWAIELVPGKEYSTTLPFDLHITSAVLPIAAKDQGRSVVTLAFEEDKEKAFSIVSLSLTQNASQPLDVVLDEDTDVTFTVHGKNPVHLSGYYVNENQEGMYDDDEVDSDEFGEEMGIDSEDESEGDDVDEEVDPVTMGKFKQFLDGNKRKAEQLQNGGEAKKAKAETAQQPKKPQQNTPSKPEQKAPQHQQQQKPQQQQKQQQQQKPKQGAQPQHQHQHQPHQQQKQKSTSSKARG